MRRYILIIVTIAGAMFTSSCSSLLYRTETDTYTIIDRDTTVTVDYKNEPGKSDKGIIYPTPKTKTIERNVLQHDSEVTRTYPDFIRVGLFESVGVIGGNTDYSLGTEIFGLYPDFNSIKSNYRGTSGKLFTGGIYRFGIYEARLRWFDDAPDWTLGVHGYEAILPDARGERMLTSVAPIYIRKRFYQKRTIPYSAFTLAFGVGLFPSIYLNSSASYDIGSLGGLNLRAYAGLVLGMNPTYAPQIRDNDFASDAETVIFPYIGIGISMIDFLNLPEETEHEAKEMQHSAWSIGLFDLSFMGSTGTNSIFSKNEESKLFNGFSFKLINTDLATPILNYRTFVGTTLYSMNIYGKDKFIISILPIRFGIWQPLWNNDLSLVPYAEVSYYPSKAATIGAKANVRISDNFNFFLNAGFATASSVGISGNDINKEYGIGSDFSTAFFGFGLSFRTRIFQQDELRYFKEK